MGIEEGNVFCLEHNIPCTLHSTNIMDFTVIRLLVVILNAVSKVSSQLCSTNWRLLDETYYKEMTSLHTFQDAQEYCRQIGGELAMPKTTAQNDFLRDQNCRPPQGIFRYWIGMTDLRKENAFRWEDGTFLDWGNARWAPAEPNNKWEQDCVAFILSSDTRSNGKWSTERCSSNLYPLCSKPLVLPRLSQSPMVEEIGTTSFQLSWHCWTNAEDPGDGPVLGYYIHLSTVQDPTEDDLETVGFVLAGDPCEFLVEHLHIKTEYYTAVSILHGDSKRRGPPGPMAYLTTHDAVLPVLLEPPEAIDEGTSYVVISWRPWTGQAGEGEGPVAGYNVKIKDGTTWKKLGTLAPFGVDLEFNVTGLQPTSPSELMVTVNYIDGREGPPGQILSVFSEPNESSTDVPKSSSSFYQSTSKVTTPRPWYRK